MCNVSVQSSIIHNHVQDYISSFVNMQILTAYLSFILVILIMINVARVWPIVTSPLNFSSQLFMQNIKESKFGETRNPH